MNIIKEKLLSLSVDRFVETIDRDARCIPFRSMEFVTSDGQKTTIEEYLEAISDSVELFYDQLREEYELDLEEKREDINDLRDRVKRMARR